MHAIQRVNGDQKGSERDRGERNRRLEGEKERGQRGDELLRVEEEREKRFYLVLMKSD